MSGDRQNQNPGYDTQEVNVKKVFTLVLLGVIILAAILYGLDKYFVFETQEEVYQEVLKPVSRSLVELEQRDQKILNSYGVVDSADGVYRIPIDSAMQIILREAQKSGNSEK